MQNILLQGRAPDVLGNVMQGNQTAYQQGQMARENALNKLFQAQGAGIAAGNPDAVNALAAFDPATAQQITARRQQMDQSAAASARAAAAAKQRAQMEAERQQALQMLGQAAVSLKTGDARPWNMVMAEVGAPGLEPTAENFELVHGLLMQDVDSLMSGVQGPAPMDPQDRYKVVGNVMYDLAAEGGPQPVGRGESSQPGFSVTTPDGVVVNYGNQPMPGQNPVTTGTPRDPGKMAEESSKADVAYLESEKSKARAAEDLKGYASALKTTAPNIGYTGPGGKLYGALDQAIGVLPGDEAQRGVFKSASMDARLTFTEKTKGAITDREMGDFATAVPNEAYGPETNALLSDALVAGAERVEKRYNFMEAWAGKYGTLQGAEEVWDRYMNENPIFSGQGKNFRIATQPPDDYRAYLNAKPSFAYTPEAIMGMSAEELNMAPVEMFTVPQLDALSSRLQSLGGQ